MHANAGELFETMKVRLSQQKDGTTNPPENVKDATNMLVDKLSRIPPDEDIITENDPPFLARYVRVKTGEVLAEIYE